MVTPYIECGWILKSAAAKGLMTGISEVPLCQGEWVTHKISLINLVVKQI